LNQRLMAMYNKQHLKRIETDARPLLGQATVSVGSNRSARERRNYMFRRQYVLVQQ
jgi:hypothetical protein